MKLGNNLDNESNNFCETPNYRIEIRDDGIMHIHVKSEFNWDIKESLELFEDRKKIANGKAFLMLYTGSKFVTPSNEVRKFVSSQKRNELVIADAYVFSGTSQKMIGNFYIKFDKPIRPTKMFSNIEKGIQWLKGFKK